METSLVEAPLQYSRGHSTAPCCAELLYRSASVSVFVLQIAPCCDEDESVFSLEALSPQMCNFLEGRPAANSWRGQGLTNQPHNTKQGLAASILGSQLA